MRVYRDVVLVVYCFALHFLTASAGHRGHHDEAPFHKLGLRRLLERQAAANSFGVYQPDWLKDELGTDCINALSKNITCPNHVLSFMQPKYHGTLDNITLTDSVCTTNCQASLKDWFNSVATACAGKTVNNAIPMKLGGYMWAGWNETCAKDPKTKQYCNDVIANFTKVSDITKMPKTELCSTCYTRRLSMMQSTQYSVYDARYKSDLEYLYSICGGTGPTAIPPPLTPVPATPDPYCATGVKLTTKAGDTCDSLASTSSVSAAALYMGNQDLIPSCSTIDPGLSLCIPATCTTYKVKTGDTCLSIETAYTLEYNALRAYNSWINNACSNLQAATNFYGKTICISPQGGTFSGLPPPPAETPNHGGSGNIGDGYTRNAIAPPQNATVAKGTTLRCGKWHVVTSADTCAKICVSEAIVFDVFLMVNPSLGKETACTGSLKVDSALCVGPTYNWNSTIEVPETIVNPTSLGSSGVRGSTSTRVGTSTSVAKVSTTTARPVSSSVKSSSKSVVSSTKK